MTPLKIADKIFTSRLFTGTGKFSSNETMEKAIIASESQMVTVAMKRIRTEDKNDDMLKHILRPGIQLLPNTSGVRNAKEAIFAAQLSREAFGTNWLKWDSSFFPIVRQTLFCVSDWKMQELPPLCLWEHPLVPTRDCKPKNFLKSS